MLQQLTTNVVCKWVHNNSNSDNSNSDNSNSDNSNSDNSNSDNSNFDNSNLTNKIAKVEIENSQVLDIKCCFLNFFY